MPGKDHSQLTLDEATSMFETQLAETLGQLPDGVKVRYEIADGKIAFTIHDKPGSFTAAEEQALQDKLYALSVRLSDTHSTTKLDLLNSIDKISAQLQKPATLDDFHSAVRRLLGEKLYNNLIITGYSTHDFCREVAQCLFIGTLSEKAPEDLVLVQKVARRLWAGDGVSGLMQSTSD